MFERTSSNPSSCSACFVFFLTLTPLLPHCHVPSIHPHLFSLPLSLLIFLCLYVSGVLLFLCLCLCLCVAWTCQNWPRPPRRSFKRWVFSMQVRALAFRSPFSTNKVLVLVLEPVLEWFCTSPPEEPSGNIDYGYGLKLWIWDLGVFCCHHLVAMKTTWVTQIKTWTVQGIWRLLCNEWFSGNKLNLLVPKKTSFEQQYT